MNLRDPRIAIAITACFLLGAFIDVLFFSHATSFKGMGSIGKGFVILFCVGLAWLVVGQFLFRKK